MSVKKSCVLDYWLVDDSALSLSFFGIGLVERTFCCSCFKQRFIIGRERGRCLKISLVVRPSHVIKFPFFIDQKNVDFIGQPAAACK